MNHQVAELARGHPGPALAALAAGLAQGRAALAACAAAGADPSVALERLGFLVEVAAATLADGCEVRPTLLLSSSSSSPPSLLLLLDLQPIMIMIMD